MAADLIKTEAELIAALSVPGRYLEHDRWFNETGSWEAYIIIEFPYLKDTVCTVDPEVARQWIEQHDPRPHLITWCLPEFALPDWGKFVRSEDELIKALSLHGRTLETNYLDDEGMENAEDQKWVILQYSPYDPAAAGELAHYVDPELAAKWTEGKSDGHPQFGPFCGSWSLPGFRLAWAGGYMDDIKTEDELIAVLSAPGRSLECVDHRIDAEDGEISDVLLEWQIFQRYDPQSVPDVIADVDEEFALNWTEEHKHPDPLAGPGFHMWSIPEYRLKDWPPYRDYNAEDDLIPF